MPLRLGETEQYAAVVTSAHLPQERWDRDVRVRFRDCGRGERGDECGPSRDVDFVYQGATDTFVRATPAPRERDCGAE